MPVAGFSAIAKQLHEEGHYLAGVPGFYHDMAGNWTISKERRGILVPARTPEGKIQGLQIRLDSIKKGKFRWITSIGKQDGCKAECWTHIAGEPTPTVLLTEGPMKADVIHHITGLTVIAGTRRQFPESSEGNTGVRAVQGNHQDHDGIRHGLSEESPCEGWLFQSGHYAGSGWD